MGNLGGIGRKLLRCRSGRVTGGGWVGIAIVVIDIFVVAVIGWGLLHMLNFYLLLLFLLLYF